MCFYFLFLAAPSGLTLPVLPRGAQPMPSDIKPPAHWLRPPPASVDPPSPEDHPLVAAGVEPPKVYTYTFIPPPKGIVKFNCLMEEFFAIDSTTIARRVRLPAESTRISNSSSSTRPALARLQPRPALPPRRRWSVLPSFFRIFGALFFLLPLFSFSDRQSFSYTHAPLVFVACKLTSTLEGWPNVFRLVNLHALHIPCGCFFLSANLGVGSSVYRALCRCRCTRCRGARCGAWAWPWASACNRWAWRLRWPRLSPPIFLAITG